LGVDSFIFYLLASRATDGTQPSSTASPQPRGGPVSASHVWAARRRSRPITLSSVRNGAATSISSAASMQQKYNETKLALRRQRPDAKMQQMRIQHAAKMANLALEARLSVRPFMRYIKWSVCQCTVVCSVVCIQK